uniref:UPF3B regulator of nonsense mediated mRNA decay n=1 Tax=Bubo bubo TaxID=30461 RepID=A0A8C0FUF4_BUBBB
MQVFKLCLSTQVIIKKRKRSKTPIPTGRPAAGTELALTAPGATSGHLRGRGSSQPRAGGWGEPLMAPGSPQRYLPHAPSTCLGDVVLVDTRQPPGRHCRLVSLALSVLSFCSLYPHMFSRAYINFKNQEDIVLFRDRFDGYVFVDHKGQEYAAIVEFAPFQKAAKKKSKKKDAKTGTIEDDPEYKKFLESYSADDEKLTSTPETLLEEIEARNKELIAWNYTVSLCFSTQRLREEKREERRRRELERKRQREEERRKWKEEERRKRKEAEKMKKVDRCPEKERDRSKEEPKIKDRPAMQLYQPGARSRSRLCQYEDSGRKGGIVLLDVSG